MLLCELLEFARINCALTCTPTVFSFSGLRRNRPRIFLDVCSIRLVHNERKMIVSLENRIKVRVVGEKLGN